MTIKISPEEYLHQIDAHMIFIMWEQPVDPLAYNQWHKQKVAYIQWSISGIALSKFLRLHGSYKSDWSSFVASFENQFFSLKSAYYAQNETQALRKKQADNVRHFALRAQQLAEKSWCNECAATISLKCIRVFHKKVSTKTEKFWS